MLVFAALISFFNMTGEEEIASVAGLADRQPLLAACIAIGLFSLAGLPIFVGFTAKFYLFTAVADGGFLWLAGLAIFTSLISLYYYLQVIRQMYIQPALAASVPTENEETSGEEHGDAHDPHHAVEGPSGPPLARPAPVLLAVLGVSLLVVVWLGVYPAPLLEWTEVASRAVLPGAAVP